MLKKEADGGPFPPVFGREPTEKEKVLAKGQETKSRNQQERRRLKLSDMLPSILKSLGIKQGSATRRDISRVRQTMRGIYIP